MCMDIIHAVPQALWALGGALALSLPGVSRAKHSSYLLEESFKCLMCLIL